MRLLYLLPLAIALQTWAGPLFQHEVENIELEPPKTKRTIPESHVQHEKRTLDQARRWTRLERAEPDANLPMRIGLKQRNMKEGHDLLMEISDPKSKNYGKHLSPAEVIEFFAPSDESVDLAKSWLVQSGIPSETISLSLNKQWLQFDAPTNQVEDLLMTDYHVYEHGDTGVKNVACEEYHVPKHVQKHIDYITPGIKLMGFGDSQEPVGKKRSTNLHDGKGLSRLILPVEVDESSVGMRPANEPVKLNGGCDKYITPDCIRKLYKIPKGTKAHPENKMGIFQGLGQHYTQHDLDTFFWGFTSNIPNGTFPELRSVNGGEGPVEDIRYAGSESNLDFQMAYGLIWPQQAVLFQVDDEVYQRNQTMSNVYRGFFNNLWNAIDGSYCTFSAFNETGNCNRAECLDPSYPNPHPDGYKGELMCGVYNATNIITISYSGGEADLPYSYQQRQCAEIMKLGLQGTTVLIASGDYGVASFQSDPRPDGCIGPAHDVFHPQFLSNCPYILSVGSTVLPTNQNAENGTEVATTRFGSGSGFSNVFERPTWQEKHVPQYLDAVDLPFEGYEGGGLNFSGSNSGLGRYNKLGRAYPDVAANGDNFVISTGGELVRIGGTSASCPLFGSILNMINEERLEAGKSPVGFVHQVLYDHPEVFTDITQGNSPGCDTDGFPATKGWDPVTGLGTPVYPKLLELFMSLP